MCHVYDDRDDDDDNDGDSDDDGDDGGCDVDDDDLSSHRFGVKDIIMIVTINVVMIMMLSS